MDTALSGSATRKSPQRAIAGGDRGWPRRGRALAQDQRGLSRRRSQIHALPDSAGQARAGTGLRHRRTAGSARAVLRRRHRFRASAARSRAERAIRISISCSAMPRIPTTLAAIEGPFDYIVIADTIGMFEDIDGTLRLIHQLCAPSTRIVISYYSHLWEPVLKTARSAGLRRKQPSDQLHRHRRLSQPDGPRRFRGDQPRAAATAAAAPVRARHLHQQIHRAAAGHPAAVPAHLSGRPAR